MDALEVKKYLYENQDKLIELLNYLGLSQIHYSSNKKEIRCAYEDNKNPTGIRIKLTENLSYKDFVNMCDGDIYGLVRHKMNLNKDDFYPSFKYVCDFINVGTTFIQKKDNNIFGGIFNQFKKNVNNLEYDIKTYPMDILDDYEMKGNKLFQDDGIDLLTQRKFKIGYDWYTHRIVIPEFSFEGELVGITGRYNGQDYKKQGEPKYFPLIEFPKSQVLFGYSQNYYNLCNSNIFLVESQKSVMRMNSMGKYNFLALGGKSLSPIQVKYILNLNPKNIIISLDEDATEEDAMELCKMLRPKSTFLNYKVGYIYDDTNTYLKKDSKDSICDLKLNEIKECTKNKMKWVG